MSREAEVVALAKEAHSIIEKGMARGYCTKAETERVEYILKKINAEVARLDHQTAQLKQWTRERR